MIFTLPPTIPDDTADRQRRKGEINDALIQRFGGPLAQLLCGTGADGALGPDYGRSDQEEAQDQQGQSVLLYRTILFFQPIHNCRVESQNYDY
jgi:hypothetical protein